MKHENAVALTHETPVVPYSGADEKQFRESLWKYLQTEIHPEIRKQSYLSSRPNFFTIRTYGINPVKKRFARGKAVKLTEQEKEEFRRKIVRLVTIEKEYTEGQNRIEHYSKILAEILKMDNVRLLFQDNKPVIEISFENDMVAFIFQNGCIEHEWKQIIKTTEQWQKYAEQFSRKLSEITPQIMKIKSEVPPEFYERGKDVR